jgi:hypothetical protein
MIFTQRHQREPLGDPNRGPTHRLGSGRIVPRAMLLCGVLLTSPMPAVAANWLALQGLEPDDAPRLTLWGFLQPVYSATDGTLLQGGAWSGQPAVFNVMTPELRSHQTFQIRRARAGIRGRLDRGVNYFVLTEFGNNGITGAQGSARLTDASVTLSYIPGIRIRAGQFKTPGSEEALQAIFTYPYINFTNVTDQLLLERFFDGDGSDPLDANLQNGPVGAFRDIGLQTFNFSQRQSWEYSYAAMVGNGNGITRGDNDSHMDIYGYLAAERLYSGKGPYRQGLKIFAWIQSGTRTLTGAGAGEYRRKRAGLGSTVRKDRFRGAAEFVTADGMIFAGTDGGAVPGSVNNAGTAVSSFNVAPDEKAHGWYVDLGYRLIPSLELDGRYDELYRQTDTAAAEQRFRTLTLGFQYFLTGSTRLTVNHEIRSASAPNLPASATANAVLNSLDHRLSAQILAIF